MAASLWWFSSFPKSVLAYSDQREIQFKRPGKEHSFTNVLKSKVEESSFSITNKFFLIPREGKKNLEAWLKVKEGFSNT
jgi:hypothetical protein